MKVRFAHPAIGEVAIPIRDEEFLIIGRDDVSAGMELNWDPKISRQHARIWRSRGELWLEDLGSTNGTWFQGRRLHEAIRLSPGAQVLVGDTIVCPILDTLPKKGKVTQEFAQPNVGPEVQVVPAPRRRQAPRFLAETKIELRIDDRADFAELWTSDISKGGMFIETNTPPAFGTPLEIQLSTPDGTLVLSAMVVHTESDSGGRAGMGVKFDKLSENTRAAIERYLAGIERQLFEEAGTESIDIEPADLAEARHFLIKVSEGDFYGAIRVPPDESAAALATRVRDLHRVFTKSTADASAPVRARLESAERALTRVERLICSPDRRLLYDFRNGHVRAEERLDAALKGSGPSVEVLQKAWQQVEPSRIDQASALMRQASALKDSGQLERALRFARQALDLSPFDSEIRKTVEELDK